MAERDLRLHVAGGRVEQGWAMLFASLGNRWFRCHVERGRGARRRQGAGDARRTSLLGAGLVGALFAESLVCGLLGDAEGVRDHLPGRALFERAVDCLSFQVVQVAPDRDDRFECRDWQLDVFGLAEVYPRDSIRRHASKSRETYGFQQPRGLLTVVRILE